MYFSWVDLKANKGSKGNKSCYKGCHNYGLTCGRAARAMTVVWLQGTELGVWQNLPRTLYVVFDPRTNAIPTILHAGRQLV